MNWALAILCLLVTWGIGWCIVVIVSPQLRSDRQAAAVAGVFSLGLGIAATSCCYWLWINLLRTTGLPYLALEAALAIVLAGGGHVCWHRAQRPPLPAGRMRAQSWLIFLIIAAAMVVSFAGLLAAVMHHPHGGWDAWDAWNLKAKYLYFAGPVWTNIFHSGTNHDGYPLLLPLTVARLWCYMGSDSVVGPQAAVVMFMLLLTLTPVAAMLMLRGATAAMVSLLVLLSWQFLLVHAAMQYADLPLAGMMVAALLATCAALEVREHARLWYVVAGALTAAAAWTKNEGIAFALLLAVMVCAVMLLRRRGGRMLPVLLLGAAVPLICLAWMKLQYVPAGVSPFSALNPQKAWANAFDAYRHVHILRTLRFLFVHCMGGGWMWLAIVAWMLLRGLRVTAGFWVWLIALLGQMTIYYLFYLITSERLEWHLHTSAMRLFTQVWPLLALLPMLLVRPAGQLDYNPPPCPSAEEASPAPC